MAKKRSKKAVGLADGITGEMEDVFEEAIDNTRGFTDADWDDFYQELGDQLIDWGKNLKK